MPAAVAALARQAHALAWELAQVDPPRSASRHFRHERRNRSVNPDAFGVLRRGPATWSFFLEWERRAVRPSTMATRIAPYLRYYLSHSPIDDHGARPSVLIVFDDDIAATNFLRVARDEIAWLLGTTTATLWRWRNAGIRPNTDYLLAIQDLADSKGLGHLLPPIRVIKVPVRGPAEGVRAE